MGQYIDISGNYYEGDRQGMDQEVPQRPSFCYRWRNKTWEIDPERIVVELESAVQSHLNAQAKTRGYDDIKSAALRAGYPGPFHADGVAYATWMDACWAHCYQVLAAVQTGTRAIPTAAELLAELPVLALA